MATLTKFPGTVSQTTGGNYRTFSDLNNIKVIGSGLYATSSANIKGKSSSPNRPSTISCTNFNFGLPTGAEVTKVNVHYNHRKNVSDLRVGSPTITLLGVSGKSVKGVAPTTSFKQSSHSFTGLTRTQVNSSSFGVKIDYPSNTSTSEGTLSIGYVRIIVEYKLPSYTVGVKRASGGYNGEEYAVECSISNKNLTSFNPTLTLSAPAGFSYKRAEGTGTATMVNNRTVTWNPNLTSKVGTSTIRLVFDVSVTYPVGTSSYTGSFSLVESLYGTTGSYSATITDRPVTEQETSSDSQPVITDDDTSPVPIKWDKVLVGEGIDVDTSISDDVAVFGFPVNENGEVLLLEKNTPITRNNYDITSYNGTDYYGRGFGGFSQITFYVQEPNKFCIKVYEEFTSVHYPWEDYKDKTPLISYFFEAIPNEEDLTTPYFSILEPSEEELNRLGDGYTYIAQSDIKNTTTDTNSRDWYKNNRIGIHNNPLFEDDATTTKHNDEWVKYNPNNITITRGEEYTSVTGSNYRYGVPISNNCKIKVETRKPTQSTGTLLSIWGYNSTPLSASQLLLFSVTEMGMTQGTFANIEMTVTPTTVTVKNLDNDTTITKEYSTTYNLIMNFWGTTFDYKNFKVCLPDNPTNQEIFENAEYWSKQTAGLNEYNNVECEFTYDEQYPLYILMTGDYPEATSYGYDMGSIKYDTPCIIEKQVYNNREASGTYPVPIEALLDGEDIATLELASNQTSQGTVLYDFPVDETISTNDKLAIRGLQVRANIEATDNLVIQAKLHSPNGELGNRSILIDSQDEEIVIGGLGDLWGFTTLQMQHLGLWELELSVANILSQSDSSILFNNVEIIFYLETVEKQEITIKVEDEDIAYYGAFIDTIQIPEGLETNTSYITIDGTDMNDAYRQNIKEKTITIDFNISECDLKTSTDLLRQITKLFTNEKDQYNRPIPKRIQFSHYPDDYFEYIMEEAFDVKNEITGYNVQAKLTIPSGTSYSRKDTVTNTVGNANGLAALRPIITIQPSTANIEIKETLSEQSFTMTYPNDWTDKIIEIDCDDRIVLLKDDADDDDGVDISKYVDHNSDWFRLSGEFQFEAINCVIRTVTFNERW